MYIEESVSEVLAPIQSISGAWQNFINRWPDYAIRLYRYYGEESLELLRDNPYLLTADGIGAPFGAADALARELGIADFDPNRIRAGIQYVLHHNERNGHCFIPIDQLTAGAARQLGLEPEETMEQVLELAEEGGLVREQIAGKDACYLPDMYRAETETAARLGEMARAEENLSVDLDSLIADCEREQGIRLLKKRGFDNESADYKERQKTMAFLRRKGYPTELIRRLTGGGEDWLNMT